MVPEVLRHRHHVLGPVPRQVVRLAGRDVGRRPRAVGRRHETLVPPAVDAVQVADGHRRKGDLRYHAVSTAKVILVSHVLFSEYRSIVYFALH